MRFLKRMRYRKPKPLMGLEEVDGALKAGLWDVMDIFFFSRIAPAYEAAGPYSADFERVSYELWHSWIKRPTDARPSDPFSARETIRREYFQADTQKMFCLIEILGEIAEPETRRDAFLHKCNTTLEREKSPYRFIGGKLARITDEKEIAEIEQAQDGPDVVANHMRKAVALFADRQNPDYANAVKESVSAVEAAARILLGDDAATLGQAINKLKKAGVVHPAFAGGASRLYGWSSDTVRHAAKKDQPELGEPEARFMLVTCSAMANFLLSKTTQ